MQQIPQATAKFYRAQQRIADLTGRAVAKQWRGLGDDFDLGWERIRPGVTEVVQAGMAASVRSAAAYTPALLAETRVDAPPAGKLELTRFSSSAPDGSELAGYFHAAPIRAKQAVAAGATGLQARQMAGAWLMSKVLTVLADTRRDVVSVDMAQRPALTGYVRMLNPPSCKDCAILAGKWFRWNEGFERHPNCDCVHIPATNQKWAESEGFISDPYEYFNSLTEAQQDRLFTRAGAQTVRDGGDIYRVVNIQNRGLGVSRQAVKYGTPMRMRPQDIYDLGLPREQTIQILAREGYITGPQIGGGNIVGRYREAYQTPISRPIVPGSKRDRVLRARATGVRDPLDRVTMTAQERRLFDAVYQREFARKYGYLPRTIGQNSADLYSGLVGRAATADRLALLDGQIARQLSKIRPTQQSMLRLVEKLGLNGDEFATGQVFRQIENRVGTAAIARTQTGSAGGGGRVPPTRGLASGDAGDPDDARIWTRAVTPSAGGKVHVPAAVSPEAHELETAGRLAAAGFAIRFRRIDHTKGAKNPDIEIGGIVWEMKSPRGSGKNTVSRQLARSAGQARRLVYDNARSSLSDREVLQELRRRLTVSKFHDEILFVAKNGDVTLISRTGILG